MQQDAGVVEDIQPFVADRESPFEVSHKDQPLTTPGRQSKNSVFTHSSQNFQTTQASN